MISLGWWETFAISAALSILTLLQSKLTNQTELAAISAAISFLQALLAGQVGKSAE